MQRHRLTENRQRDREIKRKRETDRQRGGHGEVVELS